MPNEIFERPPEWMGIQMGFEAWNQLLRVMGINWKPSKKNWTTKGSDEFPIVRKRREKTWMANN